MKSFKEFVNESKQLNEGLSVSIIVIDGSVDNLKYVLLDEAYDEIKNLDGLAKALAPHLKLSISLSSEIVAMSDHDTKTKIVKIKDKDSYNINHGYNISLENKGKKINFIIAEHL